MGFIVILMEISMKENTRIIKEMNMVYILILTDLNMKEYGKII